MVDPERHVHTHSDGHGHGHGQGGEAGLVNCSVEQLGDSSGFPSRASKRERQEI